MLFNSSCFAICFILFVAAYYLLPITQTARIWFLFVTGLAFYATFSPRFLPYLLGTGLIDYYVAAAISRTSEDDPRKRKLLLVASLTLNVLVLVYFKYANFFLDNANHVFEAVGWNWRAPALQIILPIGISFYTFQSMSYVIDVYRGTFVPRKRLHEFLASLTFFPHLLAGPIVRAAQFLPQLRRTPVLTTDSALRGGALIVGGLVKKTIADMLAPTVEGIFHSHAPHSALAAWSGVLSFAGQMYGDFSGYTDIAIGLSLLIGFELPVNFNLPYLAKSPIDFWSRWHISLATWLRDYLYMPLAWKLRPSVGIALVLTWLIGGLWHGARWSFVVWGGYNGLLLLATHFVQKRWPGAFADDVPWPWRIARVLATFYAVLIGYVLFRSTTLASALTYIVSMHRTKVPSVYTFQACLELVLAVVAIVFCHALDGYTRWSTGVRYRVPLFFTSAILGLWFVLMFGTADHGFIYFAF